MKKFLLLLLCFVGTLVSAQTYDPIAGTVNIYMVQSVKAPMYSCTPQPYCTPQWVQHTGDLSASLKNLRTGENVSQSFSGVTAFTVNITVHAQPGDVIQYATNNTIHCPLNQAGSSSGIWPYGYLEIAFTRVEQGAWISNTPDGKKSTYHTFLRCSNVPAGAVPDFHPATITIDNTIVPPPGPAWYYDQFALCYTPAFFKDWVCAGPLLSRGNFDNPGPQIIDTPNCTYNP